MKRGLQVNILEDINVTDDLLNDEKIKKIKRLNELDININKYFIIF
jgi:hypothetical protein